MWRVGFPTPKVLKSTRFPIKTQILKNEDDNALYCGGFGVQHDHNGGKCGICGDPWDDFPRCKTKEQKNLTFPIARVELKIS